MPRPPIDDDPTSEEEAPKFDGTRTDQLDDTYRFRVVSSSESGKVGFDDRGNAQWKWNTELGLAASADDGTFDQLKALDAPALTIESTPQPASPAKPSRKVGYDPYATAVGDKTKDKSRR